MFEILIYSLLSVLVVSLISLIGIFALSIKAKKLEVVLIYMIAFSAGGLLGNVFFHLIPEIVEHEGFGLMISSFILLGIGTSFFVEKVIYWRHCHHPTTKEHPHHLAFMNLFGDGVHNFIDGLIIGASYLISIPVGLATTLAVLFHEIPQEIGDFGVLLYSGYSKTKALAFNFLISLTAFAGAFLIVIVGSQFEEVTHFLIPFAAGNFIYIAAADLIPEMHKHSTLKKSLLQLLFFAIGILVMAGLVVLGGH